ncbi:vitamin K-dependent gamma-carboxylase-like protein [Chitinophaga niastensis]|uniref:Vitamin K-dependent gamma-carboxylase-like protein n=1 Tax=Chitinophaga niastensis TaxID=536980 RepID=A0A2P8HAT2_CHINA|nr:HTTM domain-containing protein [Chitinophaga niastensis]PSL43320.1 vitamin K-dependent gamma-carboxylase-like protein [Chitinophaga niastensis]
MKKPIRARIFNFFFKPSSPYPLAFLRISVALLLITQLLWLYKSLPLLYGHQALIPWPVSQAIMGNYTPNIEWVAGYADYLHISPDDVLWIFIGVYLFVLVVFLLGIFTRVMAVLVWALHYMLVNTGFMSAYGVESFAHIILFYCIFMPVGNAWSFDARKGNKQADNEWNTLSVRVLQLHLCIIYFFSGIEKAVGIQWWNGEAIWRTLMQDQFKQFDMSWMAYYPWVAKIICWSTLLLEIGYPFYMWGTASRKYGLIAIILLHLGIAVFLGLQLFAVIMIIFSVAAFGKLKPRKALGHSGAAAQKITESSIIF